MSSRDDTADQAGLVRSARVRVDLATGEIRSTRQFSNPWEDENIVRRWGFRDLNDYWLVRLSSSMKTSNFVDVLESHLMTPERFANELSGRAFRIRAVIETSLREDFAAREAWFIEPRRRLDPGANEFSGSMLRSREAAEWFLRTPLRRDHLPATLVAFLSGEGSPAPVDANYILSGAPGRPDKSTHLIKDEFDRLCDAGTLPDSTTDAARKLLAWLYTTHPLARRPTEKSIRNLLPKWRRSRT